MENKVYTIKDLNEGKCAVKNDGTLKQLRKILSLAFPNDITTKGIGKIYYAASLNSGSWSYTDNQFFELPIQSVITFIDGLTMGIKPQINVGDEVKIVNNSQNGHKIGTIGTVLKLTENKSVKYGFTALIQHEKARFLHDFEYLELKSIKNENQTKITRLAISEIYPSLCNEWKSKVDELLKLNQFNVDIPVPLCLVKDAYSQALNTTQASWLKLYFPKPKKLITKSTTKYSAWDGNEYPDLSFRGMTDNRKDIQIDSLYPMIAKVTVEWEVYE